MTRARYTDYLTKSIDPSWLSGPWGQRFLRAWGVQLDAIADDAEAAIKVRFVEHCPADALSHHGEERSLPRGPAETEAQYRDRLEQAWEIWRKAGTPTGLIEILQAFLPTATIQILAVRDWIDYWGTGTWGSGGAWGYDPPDHDGAWWSRFWVVLQETDWAAEDVWGGTSVWGDGGTWGSTATSAEIATLRLLIKTFRPARDICVGIIVLLDGDLWYPTTPWASGTWGGHSVTWPGA